MAKETKAEKAEREAAELVELVASQNKVNTEVKEPGKIEQILAHHKAGKTVDEIVALGFNKTTVKIQTARYIKNTPGAKKNEPK